jgi:DnaJ-class molecular chaperone
MPRGDIHLTVNVLPHEKFNRQGDDLHYSLQINCIDAILGKSTQVTTIEGKTLELNIPPGTQHGAMLSAAGHGMLMMNDNRFRGRMIINVEIVVPKFITDEQKAILIQHFQ